MIVEYGCLLTEDKDLINAMWEDFQSFLEQNKNFQPIDRTLTEKQKEDLLWRKWLTT